MDKNYFSFEKLNVWQESRNLVKDIYLLLREFPMEEKYALCDQIRRAVVSVPSNIAEGAGRMSPKEKSHYIEIAFGHEDGMDIIKREASNMNKSIAEIVLEVNDGKIDKKGNKKDK